MALRHIRTMCYNLLAITLFWCLTVANNEMAMCDLLATTPQEFTCLIQDTSQLNQPIVVYDVDQVKKSFLTHYFAPWTHPLAFFSSETLRKKEGNRLEAYYRHSNPSDFIRSIGDNMVLSTFPNQDQPAIVVCATHLRSMPSMNAPSDPFGKSRGNHLFDKWQESLLAPNEPLYVLHTSQDRVWDYVITGSHINGWVQRADIAYVTRDFITRWQTGQYVTPLRDKLPVKGDVSALTTRIGQLIPLAHTQDDQEHYRVFTVSSDSKGMATIQVSKVSRADTTIMPLLATPNNIIRLANSLLGQPYDWGGTVGYRDCSSTMKDLFFPFCIWLPRDSGPQSKAGTFISLKGLSNNLKEKKIVEIGTPLFSLVWQPGHIMLYVGEKKGKPYVYNNIWGLRTRSSDGEEGRALLKSTVIMPLDFGREYRGIEKTCLDKAEGLVLLKNRLLRPDEELALFRR